MVTERTLGQEGPKEPSLHLCKSQPHCFPPKTPMTNTRPLVQKASCATMCHLESTERKRTTSFYIFLPSFLPKLWSFLSSTATCSPRDSAYVVTVHEFLPAKASHGAVLGFGAGKHRVWRCPSRMHFPPFGELLTEDLLG